MTRCKLPSFIRLMLVGGWSVLTLHTHAAVREVTSLMDSGTGTLRQQIAASSAGDEIVFKVRGTILLASSLNIPSNIVIRGALPVHTVISGASLAGVPAITISAPGTVRIEGIKVTGMNSGAPAIKVNSGMLRLINSSLLSNNGGAASTGGIDIVAAGTLEAVSCSFFSNLGNNGGAIHSSGTLNLINCSFGMNGANSGGAIYVNSGVANLLHCTLNNNTAASTANGYAIFGNAGSISLQNNIITDVSASPLMQTNSATWISHGGNMYRGTAFFGTNTNDNFTPGLFVSLSVNPQIDGYGNMYYRIASGLSPAVDKGTSPGVALMIPGEDQRRAPRIMDGDNGFGSAPDAGAFEYTKFTVSVSTGTSVAGSLVKNISDINVGSGTAPPFYIDFDIATVPASIGPAAVTNLNLNKPTIIDGYSQQGSRVAGPNDLSVAGSLTTAAKHMIEINGSAYTATSGFVAGANVNDIRIYGLTMRNFMAANKAAIEVVGNNPGLVISGNHFFNNANGVLCVSTPNGHIGDSSYVGRNVVNSFAAGSVGFILAGCSDMRVAGNFIGTDTIGKASAGSQNIGIRMTSNAGGVIGGRWDYGFGNLVSGNIVSQISIEAGSFSTVIIGNLIGTDYSGNAVINSPPAGARGVAVSTNSNNIRIGLMDTLARNIISGNADANVYFTNADQSSCIGNYIGTGSNGITQVANNGNGVVLDTGSDNDTVQNCLIGGNLLSGIKLNASGSGHKILGNIIGLDRFQLTGLGNVQDGIDITGTSDVQVGSAGFPNIICASGNNGIRIDGSSFIDIDANFIGFAPATSLSMGNGSNGIHFAPPTGGNSVRIGSDGATGSPNTIKNNGGDGIRCEAGNLNTWCHNIISNNAGLGVDLIGGAAPTGPDATNDPGDADVGTNGAMNIPIVLEIQHCGSGTAVSFQFSGGAGVNYQIDFYQVPNGAGDPSGYGEGNTYLGNTLITATGGLDTFYYTFATPLNLNDLVTGIASEMSGSTPAASSEFGPLKAITPAAVLSPSATNATCSNSSDGSVSVLVSGTGSVISYSWENAAAVVVGNTSSVNGLPADIYTCQVTTLSGCILNTPALTISGNASVMAAFNLPAINCSGIPLTFTDASNTSGGPPSYAWQTSDGSNASVQNPQFTFANPGTWLVTQIVTVNGCSDTAQANVVISPSPDASFSYEPGYCILLPKDTLIPATGGGTFSGTGVNSTGIFDPFAVGAGNTSIITYTVSSGGCTSVHSDTLVVYPYVTSTITGLSSSYCQGDAPVTITINPPGGILSIDSVAQTYSGNTFVFDPNLITGGSDNIAYLYTDANGCPSVTGQVVSLLPVPPAPTSANTVYPVCASTGNQVITINPQSSGSIFWYYDSLLTNQVHVGPTINSSTLSGLNHFWIVENNGGCDSPPLEVEINVFDGSFIITNSPQTICAGQQVQLDASSVFNGNWNWYGDSTISDPTIANPFASPSVNFTYTVILNAVINGNPCLLVDSVQVFIDPSGNCGLNISNAFSPDGDNVNDTWYIEMISGGQPNGVTIFNRWGSRLLHIEDYNNADRSWDGTFNGKLVPSGTYFYTIELKSSGRLYSGWVQVVY